VILLQGHERARALTGLATAAVAAVFFLNALSPESLTRVTAGLDRLVGGEQASISLVQASNAARRVAFDSALREFAQSPVTGTGYGGVREAHNLYLQLLQGGGVLLFCTFAAFALGALGRGYQLSRDERLSPDLQRLAGALTLSVGVWLTAGLVQNTVYDRYLYVPVGFLLALSAVAARNMHTEPPLVASHGRFLRATGNGEPASRKP
jgi:O-antigen ligase